MTARQKPTWQHISSEKKGEQREYLTGMFGIVYSYSPPKTRPGLLLGIVCKLRAWKLGSFWTSHIPSTEERPDCCYDFVGRYSDPLKSPLVLALPLFFRWCYYVIIHDFRNLSYIGWKSRRGSQILRLGVRGVGRRIKYAIIS
jgi:hypothetical protein